MADSTFEMADVTVSQRLRDAREAHKDELPDLARRIGVREEHLRAIDEARFHDLPAGIYGRNAVRSYARAFGFDGDAMLAECEPLMAPLEEPIAGLCRLRGLRQPPPAAASTPLPAPQPPGVRASEEADDAPAWRALAASAVDGGLIAVLLLVVVVCAMTLLMVPLPALARTGPAFGLMGLLFGAAYFAWFGGLRGRTIGQQLLGVDATGKPASPITLSAIAARAVAAATEDARFIRAAGTWTGTVHFHGGGDNISRMEQPASR